MNLLILVVDDEPDVEVLFRQQFRRDLREGRFAIAIGPYGTSAHRRCRGAVSHPDPVGHQHAGDERP